LKLKLQFLIIIVPIRNLCVMEILRINNLSNTPLLRIRTTHQTSQRFVGFIGDPDEQLYVSANAGKFIRGPKTRNFAQE